MAENPVFIRGAIQYHAAFFSSVYSSRYLRHSRRDGCLLPDVVLRERRLQAALNIEQVYSFLVDPVVALERHARWCEKSTKNILFAGRFLNYFGDRTRFINVVRDGRDVVTSKHLSDPDAYFVQPEEWVRDVAAGRRIEDDPRVITVRYEEFI